MAKNVLHVTPKSDEHRDRLVDEYTFLGYFVQVKDGRVVVNSKHPKKPKKDEKDKKSEKDRPRRNRSERD